MFNIKESAGLLANKKIMEIFERKQLKNSAAAFIRPQKSTAPINPLANMPKLLDAALNEFSTKSFGSASLNNIIRASGMSKGSFYHKFADKMDLYLCVLDCLSVQKMALFQEKYRSSEMPADFFDQIRCLVRQGMDFALSEPRYNALWKRHLAEGPDVKEAVKAAFPSRGRDDLAHLIRSAFGAGQFRDGFRLEFIQSVVSMLICNADSLIKPDMRETEITALLDGLIDLLKSGLKKC